MSFPHFSINRCFRYKIIILFSYKYKITILFCSSISSSAVYLTYRDLTETFTLFDCLHDFLFTHLLDNFGKDGFERAVETSAVKE